MALLQLDNLSKLFGHLEALSNINLKVEQGELLGVVGPNGSGKTTLFNNISGFYRPTKGKVIYQSKDITKLRPDQRAAKGIIRTFQSNIVYRDATTRENILRAAFLESKTNIWQAFLNSPAYRKEERAISMRVDEALDFWSLTGVKDVLASELSHGDQRRLGLAIAAVANPNLLLIDEPVAGMTGEERTTCIKHIKRLNETGVTVIIVEHHVQTVVSLCSRLVVLNFGRIIADGKPQEVTKQENVIEAYIGTEEETV